MKNQTSNMQQKQDETMQKAKDYFFNKKEKKPFYIFHGYLMEDESDIEKEIYLSFTAEEMAHWKQLIIDVFNRERADESKVSTIEEVEKELEFFELEKCDEELDKLFSICKDQGLMLKRIDFDTQYHLYDMSYIIYDHRSHLLSDERKFRVDLTDEEYLYMLSNQLKCRETFSFNDLTFNRPDIAKKIHINADASMCNGISGNGKTFLVIFDEILDDAETIDGPIPESKTLYHEFTNEHMLLVNAYTRGRKLNIQSDEMIFKPTDAPVKCTTNCKELQDINADSLMHRFLVFDYASILGTLKQKFDGPNIYNNIKEWLIQENIPFTEELKKNED